MEALARFEGLEEELTLLRLNASKATDHDELESHCLSIRSKIKTLKLQESHMATLRDLFPGDRTLMVRSSANVEDLKGMSAAGLYESIPNVNPHDTARLHAAICEVWASMYTKRAVLARRLAKIPDECSSMAVLIQELVNPTLSFVMHTKNPFASASKSAKEIYVELVPGLGETLASGAVRGTPHRMVIDKATGDFEMLAFSSYSHAIIPVQPRKTSFSQLPRENDVLDSPVSSSVRSAVIDNTVDPMVASVAFRRQFAKRATFIAEFLESNLGGPQDVEGAIVDQAVYLVQSRPQP